MLKPKKSAIIFSLVLMLLVFAALPHFAFARGLVPCGGDTEKPCTVSDIFILIARVTNWLIAVAGIYAFYVIVGAGFWMVASVGEEEATTAKKKQLTEAVVGFVLVLMAFMMVNTAINLILGPGLINSSNTKCQLDLRNPLNYLDPNHFDPSQCTNIAH